MTDYVTLASAGVLVFFSVLAIALLARYRDVSQRISESSDLGKDLWMTLESRLRSQDERIVDIMTRLDVIQSRVLQSSVPSARREISVGSQRVVGARFVPVARVEKTEPGVGLLQGGESLDRTELSLLRALSTGPRTSPELAKGLGVTREHVSRVLKDLHARGFLIRDSSEKPFVYELSEEGKKLVSGTS
ncbi:MAG TPA: MarR family transcriptional regulator [Nitrososphaerales archaeon]|nr:MarR family transcriptional regulator [Nitrososphaerales archaeon]